MGISRILFRVGISLRFFLMFVISLFVKQKKRDIKQHHQAVVIAHTAFRFDKSLKKWMPQDTTKQSTNEKEIPTKLRIATHNVLKVTNWFLELIIRSPERFQKEMEILKELNADIIGLNEVTLPFLHLLQNQDWVRENYYLSDVISLNNNKNEEPTTVNKTVFDHSEMGCVILSKYPFDNLYSFEFSSTSNCDRDVIIGSFFDNQFNIVSAHITAYEEHFNRRETQMKELCETLDQNLHNNNVIIMGDLNLHLVKEDLLIPKIGYIDLWKPSVEDENGYTWDTKTNSLINKFLLLDRRRMRLDRIIAKKGCEWVPEDESKNGVIIFANEPVYKNRYLYCSDHFGLCTDLLYRKK